MSGLESEFGNEIEFFHLNIDIRTEMNLARNYDVYRRSQYVLLDGEGNIVKTWFGLLDEEAVAADIAVALGEM